MTSKRKRQRLRGKFRAAVRAWRRAGELGTPDFARIFATWRQGGFNAPLIPNAETIEAMLEARRGGSEAVSIDDLIADLNE